MGWVWSDPWHFQRPSKRPLALLGGPGTWWLHEIRDGLRISQWRAAAARRKDMQGLDTDYGVDRLASMALMRQRKTAPRDKARLQSLLSGSLRLQDRLHVAKIVDSPVCQFCHGANETVSHFLYECPAWQSIRQEYPTPAAHLRADWPPCTLECGIMLEPPELAQWADQGASDVAIYADAQELEQKIEEVAGDIVPVAAPQRTIVWTDGASTNNADCRLRRAGCGVFFACRDERNVSCSLPGRQQTNQRAELNAVVLALQAHAGPMQVRSDSEYVVDGANHLIQHKRLRAVEENKDLWQTLASELDQRPPDHVQFQWVKGHAKAIDVARGRTTAVDKCGNDAADLLATAGARLHAAPQDLIDAAKQNHEQATAIHALFLRLMTEREMRESAMGLHAGDEGDDEEGRLLQLPELPPEMPEPVANESAALWIPSDPG